MLGFGGLKMFGMLFAGAFVFAAIGGAYMYYKDTQARIAALVENNAKLELVAETNQMTIDAMQTDIMMNQQRTEELSQELREAEKYKDELIGKLRRHNLTMLTEQKPGLIETRVNNATKGLFDEFEQITAN